MGLMIHSLGELPENVERGFYVYLLDYGWDEPLGEALFRNFDRMAEIASHHDAIVLRGTVGAHFTDEVLSHHHVNGQPSNEMLPAILITTRNPHEFHNRQINDCPDISLQHRMLLIPLRKSCKSANDVIELIDKVFTDIKEKKELVDFKVAYEQNKVRTVLSWMH